MTFLKSAAAASITIALLSSGAWANDDEASVHDLAAQCASRGGLFDASTKECAEPSPGSAAADPVVGPMLQGLAADALDEMK